MFGETELAQQGKKTNLLMLLAGASEEAITPSWRNPGLYTDQLFSISKDYPHFQCPVNRCPKLFRI